MIPELNKLGMDVLNSRESHAFGLTGHLTVMDAVRKTSFHVRVLLSYITPALPRLFPLTGQRICETIKEELPQSHEWTAAQPAKAMIQAVSESIALVLFGADMTVNNQNLVTLTHEHTGNGMACFPLSLPLSKQQPPLNLIDTLQRIVFALCFAMRCVPEPLQPLLVWLLPVRWRLVWGWRKLRALILPRFQELKATRQAKKEAQKDPVSVSPDVISWMVQDGRNDMERDPEVLTTLIGSLAAGSTYSIGNFCSRTILDLVKNPDALEAVRDDIRQKHVEIDGRWDMTAIASLAKLESVMKESTRMTPGTLQVYSRHVKQYYSLSNGIQLRRGQYITISTSTRTRDPAFFERPNDYNGLRFCAPDQMARHLQRPFSSVDTDLLTWGAGRWACPGRIISDIAVKIDEYDFAFVDNKKPLTRNSMHEFLFFSSWQ